MDIATVQRATRGVPIQPVTERLSDHFLEISAARPIFRTNAGGDKLWEIYLDSFPNEDRQHFNCNACKSFIRRYGGLVYIDDDLQIKSAVWNPSLAPGYYNQTIDYMRDAVEDGATRITQPFCSDAHIVGLPASDTGGWHHFFIEVGKRTRHSSMVKRPHEVEAEKLQNFISISRALDSYKDNHLHEAFNMLKWESLARHEKVSGVAKAFLDLKISTQSNRAKRKELIWLYVANNPDGFCHIRSSVLGSLLDDIASGDFDGEQIAKRFNVKMDGINYQRPKAAPSVGNIEQAEKIVKSMGIERSLQRRFARFEEVPKIWEPVEVENKPSDGGVFGHLKDQGKSELVVGPSKSCSWTWFAREVLPEAIGIDLELNSSRGNFSALLTAVHFDAPCIFQWGNHFSQYVYHGGSSPGRWGLEEPIAKVTGITSAPHTWEGAVNNGNHHDCVLLILDGCRDLRAPDLAIFPETLNGELHSIRKTIEAFSRAGKLEGAEEATACGYRIEGSPKITIRVTTKTGVARFSIDLWE